MKDLGAQIRPTNKVNVAMLTAYVSQLILSSSGTLGIEMAPETAVSIVGVIQFVLMWLVPDAK